MKDFKQAIVVRTDLGMSVGKIAAQAAHASLESFKKSKKPDVSSWEKGGCRKVVLAAGGLTQLMQLADKAKEAKLPFALISDAGHTEVPAGSVTALGIGPAPEGDIDKITGNLRSL